MNRYHAIIATVLTLSACQPLGVDEVVGWPGKHTPKVGEPCNEPNELRCAYPPEDSRIILRCDGEEWSPKEQCMNDNTCNFASSGEVYCAGPINN